MSSKFRLFTRRFLVFTNSVLVFLFLLSCLAPYLDPHSWWFISFLGLAFPFLLVAVLLFMVGWLFIKRKYALISAISLLPAFKSISVFYAFHFSSSFKKEKDAGSIRIVSWNVARFVEIKKNSNKGSQTRMKMLDLLREQQADILCLQEFHTSVDPSYYNNITAVQDLGYPYYYFTFTEDGDKHYYSSIIFSRYPIIDSGFIRYPRPTLAEALLYADIKVNNDTLRVYTTHLQSLQFKKEDYQKIDEIKGGDDSLLANSKTIFSKLKRGIANRSVQADIISKVIADAPYPVLFCADLNDVPNSYTYFTVRSDMQDAFLEKGSGIGRTFVALSPTLRIDYILADNHFAVRQFARVLRKYSDHYMLVSDIQRKK